MCKLHNLKNETFVVYHIIIENYVGVTYNLRKRLLKHKSKNKFDVSQVEILLQTTNLNEALKMEEYYQIKYKCKKGVRNQNGLKNPYAKQVLHLETGFYFDTIKEACESLNFSYSHARHEIKKENNKFNLIKIN
jgi:predicted GIY-YIG superfamily endonuclease